MENILRKSFKKTSLLGTQMKSSLNPASQQMVSSGIEGGGGDADLKDSGAKGGQRVQSEEIIEKIYDLESLINMEQGELLAPMIKDALNYLRTLLLMKQDGASADAFNNGGTGPLGGGPGSGPPNSFSGQTGAQQQGRGAAQGPKLFFPESPGGTSHCSSTRPAPLLLRAGGSGTNSKVLFCSFERFFPFKVVPLSKLSFFLPFQKFSR